MDPLLESKIKKTDYHWYWTGYIRPAKTYQRVRFEPTQRGPYAKYREDITQVQSTYDNPSRFVPFVRWKGGHPRPARRVVFADYHGLDLATMPRLRLLCGCWDCVRPDHAQLCQPLVTTLETLQKLDVYPFQDPRLAEMDHKLPVNSISIETWIAYQEWSDSQ